MGEQLEFDLPDPALFPGFVTEYLRGCLCDLCVTKLDELLTEAREEGIIGDDGGAQEDAC